MYYIYTILQYAVASRHWDAWTISNYLVVFFNYNNTISFWILSIIFRYRKIMSNIALIRTVGQEVVYKQDRVAFGDIDPVL